MWDSFDRATFRLWDITIVCVCVCVCTCYCCNCISTVSPLFPLSLPCSPSLCAGATVLQCSVSSTHTLFGILCSPHPLISPSSHRQLRRCSHHVVPHSRTTSSNWSTVHSISFYKLFIPTLYMMLPGFLWFLWILFLAFFMHQFLNIANC